MRIHREWKHALFLAAIGMTLAAATPALAQSVSFNVDIGHRPHWRHVRGTRVYEVSGTSRPDYDMFRYGSYYYVYDNDRWYRSRDWRGRFDSIDDESVPAEFTRVGRNHWRDESWRERHRGD